MINDDKLELLESVLESHHIIPDYKCKELGITTSYKVDSIEYYFKQNYLHKILKKDHALIHWGYYTNDLEPLFKHVIPSQWIIDLIPIGDSRDGNAGSLIGLGVIEGIVPLSGWDHPSTKHGNLIGAKRNGYDPEIRKKYQEIPENKARKKEADKNLNQTPKRKESERKRQASVKYKTWRKNYEQTPKRKESARKRAAACYAKKKAERQGEGRLDAFFK